METIDKFFQEFENSAIVKTHFGFYPSLHDSEVIEILLNRELGHDFSGPKISLTLYAFDYRYQPDESKRKNCKLVLIFDGVELNYIRNFNHQNAMADFNMDKFYSKRLKQDRYKIKFGEFGGLVCFTCSSVKVESIEPFNPIDYFEGLK
jgi:hypothetical protein